MKSTLTLLCAVLLVSCQSRISQAPSLGNLTLVDLQGKSVHLDDFRGKKALFVNFWATWCGPCVREMPSIARAKEQLNDQVEFLFVTDEPAERIQQFADKQHLDLRFVHAENLDQLALDALPTTYMINKAGDVAHIEIGFREWDLPENLKMIQELAQ